MTTLLDIIVYGAMAAVFIILVAGIYALFRGGDFGRTWSNKLMRARVLFQFIAIIAVIGAVWAKQQFGG
ncbi:MAG: twin transmembrane helix small protein [Oceanicaulis sp.]